MLPCFHLHRLAPLMYLIFVEKMVFETDNVYEYTHAKSTLILKHELQLYLGTRKRRRVDSSASSFFRISALDASRKYKYSYIIVCRYNVYMLMGQLHNGCAFKCYTTFIENIQNLFIEECSSD